MIQFISSLSSRPQNALLTLITWLVIIFIVSFIAPSLSDVTTNDQEAFLPVGVESVRAIDLQRQKYPTGSGIPAIVVFHGEENFFFRRWDFARK